MNRRPFDGNSIIELISQHVHAPVPRLPEALVDYQILLDGMLAKDPDERLQNADEVLASIDRVWTQVALRANSAQGPG